MSTTHADRSKEKLKNYIDDEVKKLFTSILDYAEVAVDNEIRWKALRARILKISNGVIRTMKKNIDDHYEVNYVNPPGEDVVVFGKSTKNKV